MSQDKWVAGRYRLLRTLGRGGFSDVCLAEDMRLGGRKVAVKRIAYHHLSEEDRVTKFQQEAEIIGKLTSPYTVRAYDYGCDDDGRYFIVLEYVEGKTFHKVLGEEGPLSVPRTLHIGIQLLDALEEAHSLGIIHRDLKPKNIILVKQRLGDLVKVLDFGVARVLDPEEDAEENDWTLVGTASYMAPEQAQGKPISPASDLYSVGVLLYHALTGRPPFISQEDPVAVMIHHATTPVTPMREMRPDLDIPEALDMAVLKALAKKPQHRFHTAQPFRDILEQILDHITASEHDPLEDTDVSTPTEKANPAVSINRTAGWGENVSNQAATESTNDDQGDDQSPRSGTLHAHLPPPPMLAGRKHTSPLGESAIATPAPPQTTGKDSPAVTSKYKGASPPLPTEDLSTAQLRPSGSLLPASPYFAEPEPTTPASRPASPISDTPGIPIEEETDPVQPNEYPDNLVDGPSHIRRAYQEDQILLADLQSLQAEPGQTLDERPGPYSADDEDAETSLSIANQELLGHLNDQEQPSTLDLKPNNPPPNKPTHPVPSDTKQPQGNLEPGTPTTPTPSQDEWSEQHTKQTAVTWEESQTDDWEEDEDWGDATLTVDGHEDLFSVLDPPDIDDTSPHNEAATAPHIPAIAESEANRVDGHTLDATMSTEQSPFFGMPTSAAPPLPMGLFPHASNPHTYSQPVHPHQPSGQGIAIPTPFPGQSQHAHPPQPNGWSLPDAFLEETNPNAPNNPESNSFEWDDELDLNGLDDFSSTHTWQWAGVLGGFAFILGIIVVLNILGEQEELARKQRLEQDYKTAIQEGDTFIRKGLYHKAYMSYRQALELRPKDPKAQNRIHVTQLDLEADKTIKKAKKLQAKGELIKAYHLLQRINTKATLWEERGKKQLYQLHALILGKLVQQIPVLYRRRLWKLAHVRCTLLPTFSPQHPLLKRPCPYIAKRFKRIKRRR
jgi:serine/threonine-protein kinase